MNKDDAFFLDHVGSEQDNRDNSKEAVKSNLKKAIAKGGTKDMKADTFYCLKHLCIL